MEVTLNLIFIKNLNHLMKAKNVGIAELAAKAQLSTRMISYILKGERIATIVTIEKISKAFDVPPWIMLY
jgi:transcriptional regulator with XRE-family HTH domain